MIATLIIVCTVLAAIILAVDYGPMCPSCDQRMVGHEMGLTSLNGIVYVCPVCEYRRYEFDRETL